MELRIFTRDGQRFSASQRPSLAEAPDSNADLMAEFLNEKNGQTWQSIPVAVFYTKDLEYLYHYTEFPAIYHKDRLVHGPHPLAAARGDERRDAGARRPRVRALQQSPFFRLWASAAVDEIISALHRRLVVGALAEHMPIARLPVSSCTTRRRARAFRSSGATSSAAIIAPGSRRCATSRAGIASSPSGHTPNIEEPGLFNLHVAEFLAAVERGRWAGWTTQTTST